MPANLPPNYFEAEKRFREAKDPKDKIEILEEMLQIMPKHKGTDKLRGELRRKISKLKTQPQKKKGPSRKETAYAIVREGAAQITIIGPPNTGKSSLVATLTNAKPEVADFPHSTWNPTPGMAPHQNIQFQLIDTPPISKDYQDPGMADLIRRTDILVILLDLQTDPIGQLEETLSILRDLRIFPENRPIPQDLKKPPAIKKILVVANKMDGPPQEEDFEVFLELSEVTMPCMGISTGNKHNLEAFMEQIYALSEVIRIYSKAPGKDPDKKSPFVIPRESTLADLAAKIHKDFVQDLKYARIWGESVFDGQMVQKDYILQDEDIVEIHT